MPFFGKPTVTRGRIVVPSNATSREFMFNPPDISDEKQINYGSLEVPGASHPVYQYGSGGERLIHFDLYLDGDRGIAGRNLIGTIQSHVAFYRSLLYPSAFDGVGMGAVYPRTVLLTIGELYKSIPCIVKKVGVKYHHFAPDMTPVRATLSMQLAEITDKSQTADGVQPGT